MRPTEELMGFLDRLFGTKSLTLAALVDETSLRVVANSVAQIRVLVRGKDIKALGDDVDQLNDQGWRLLLEFVVFSLHLADRIALGAVGPDRRSRFVEALEQAVVGHIAEGGLADPSPKARTQLAGGFRRLFMRRTHAYGALVLPAPKAQALKGTLFWEAAKALAGEHFPHEAAGATLPCPSRWACAWNRFGT